ncbi:LysR family transcriptional regulator [Pseudomaricurvus alkylphenolicus]|jgi:DNA-binding transcriptional LysR family regulator|uniref:LysR family transcriptional regulator n=1 Tax=Pseudomaricurvus alkylphenolicus TaxID=1306991 RepID=UPI0014200DDA|nr:LysR family transcriptional regulator [Pseudomaricurvus alkylphenolicus]NIB40426.1 LysR family transcriptional regulator [Pseudomaricurvus alkylphenolicus]
MNLRSVDLNLLTIFDAIMTERKLSAAADKIGMSQPAMSAALGRLRITLKDELFLRTGSGVRPTPRALELERPIREILDKISDTIAQTQEFDPTKSDRIFTLASIDYGGIAVVPSLLQKLADLQTSVRVNIWPQYEEDLKDLMHFGSVDFALDNIPILEDDYHVETVRQEPGYCLVRKDHPDIRDELTLDQFLAAEHVVLYPKTNRISLLDQHLLSTGLRRRHGMKVPSFFNMPYIVQKTNMICALPEPVARHFAELFDLALYPAPVEDWKAPLYLMWHNSLHGEPGHRWLREMIIELCRGFNPASR